MSPIEGHIFLEGPAGTGKTARGIDHLKRLLEDGIRPGKILLLTPQRSYAAPYLNAVEPDVRYRIGRATIGGLARRIISLYWPVIASRYPFDADKPPTFLTLETAQFFMSRVVDPLIEQGYFVDVVITLPRLYSQLIDNLNKAAVNGFSIDKVASLLSSSGTNTTQVLLYEDIVKTLKSFRTYCFAHNLLDFSLYLTLFADLIRTESEARDHLLGQYDHLIFDNIEEDIPLTHDLLESWLPALQSALLIYDTDAGYRRFLGANPTSAYRLRQFCDEQNTVDTVRTTPPGLQRLRNLLKSSIQNKPLGSAGNHPNGQLSEQLTISGTRLHHAMVNEVVERVIHLHREKHVAPEDIVILSPYITDSLRHAITIGLERACIPFFIHRPSRALGDEPITRILLTLAALAHPTWEEPPNREAVVHMLSVALADCDITRAHLLADLYHPHSDSVSLGPFEDLSPSKRTRVTNTIGQYFGILQQWLNAYAGEPEYPIDVFFSRLFSELFSQKGFGFYQNIQAGIKVANVIESARKFRQACSTALEDSLFSVGKAYYHMVLRGVISALYAEGPENTGDCVLVAPAYTFLLQNRPAYHTLWLDVGSTAWYQRINQPLTNPYILSRDWDEGADWNDEAEIRFERERLYRLVNGLLLRCTGHLHIFFSELSVYGQEQNGKLLGAFHNVLNFLSNDQTESQPPAENV